MFLIGGQYQAHCGGCISVVCMLVCVPRDPFNHAPIARFNIPTFLLRCRTINSLFGWADAPIILIVCVCQGIHSIMLKLRGSTFLLSYHYCKPQVHCPALQGGRPVGQVSTICTCAANIPRLLPSEQAVRQQDTHDTLLCAVAPHRPSQCIPEKMGGGGRLCVCLCV